jgi:hypothetical protein
MLLTMNSARLHAANLGLYHTPPKVLLEREIEAEPAVAEVRAPPPQQQRIVGDEIHDKVDELQVRCSSLSSSQLPLAPMSRALLFPLLPPPGNYPPTEVAGGTELFPSNNQHPLANSSSIEVAVFFFPRLLA